MLNFLRKLRLKEMNGKYLKYAIGEIVLVVIGILIALSINNWNQKNKARTEEIIILENLKGDLFLDTLDLQSNLEMHKTFFVAEKSLLNFLQSTAPYQQDTLEFSDALSIPILSVLHNSTFNNVNNNEAGLLTNNELRNKIFRFYDFFNKIIPIMENESEVHQTYNTTKPYFLKYFRLKNSSVQLIDYSTKSEDYMDQVFEKQSLEFIKPDAARKDEAFKIELNESSFFRGVKMSIYIEVLERIDELTAAIEIELIRLRN